jgi:hypothetical protein
MIVVTIPMGMDTTTVMTVVVVVVGGSGHLL